MPVTPTLVLTTNLSSHQRFVSSHGSITRRVDTLTSQPLRRRDLWVKVIIKKSNKEAGFTQSCGVTLGLPPESVAIMTETVSMS